MKIWKNLQVRKKMLGFQRASSNNRNSVKSNIPANLAQVINAPGIRVYNHAHGRSQWTYISQYFYERDAKARWIAWNNKTNTPTLSMEYKWYWANNRDRQPSLKIERPPPPVSSAASESMIDPTPIPPSHYCDPHSIIHASTHIHVPRYGPSSIAFVAMHKWNVRIQLEPRALSTYFQRAWKKCPFFPFPE